MKARSIPKNGTYPGLVSVKIGLREFSMVGDPETTLPLLRKWVEDKLRSEK